MEKPIKLIHILLVIIIATCFITSEAYCQNNKNGEESNKGIVHNDKTGIVLDVVKKNNKQYQLKVKDKITGYIYSSIPTKIKAKQGDEVMYTELCHGTCRIKKKCKK
ncbi:MAG: hypothetical protein COC01_04265 [Bacteroidetes bacterium]|nr:MAG: hypothetical protein COC01_04265 [Bacteroidota bacterium]